MGAVLSFHPINTFSRDMRLTLHNEGNHRPLSALTKLPTQSTCPVALNHHPRRKSSHLYSLRHLVEEVSNQPTRQKGPRTIFVGGKGGVGKTTVSSALAVKLASGENDLKVLVVSTDPAHSLGDALDEDLRRGRGNPVVMTDPITNGRLQACEVDASAALEEFRRNLEAFDIMKLADALGVSPDLLQGFGLAEFSGLLNNPPPGLDELVALSNVLDSKSVASEFDVVVVDTAPTGHTLRLLALPQFLDGLLGKLIKLRMKLSGLASTLQALFGNSQADQRARAIDNAVDRLETFRTKMSGLRSRLQDSSSTSFVVVTIPTKLSVRESKRLISELSSQGVSVTDVVVNQCVTDFDSEEAVNSYYQRRKAGQDVWVNNLKDAIDKVSASTEFRENGNDSPIALTKVPFFDVELVGVPALYYLGSQCFVNNPNFSHLMEEGRADDCKVLICGGKGGVGKTTTSSSLAVSMAAKWHNVALISTDPAHSLGDAIDMNLAGGNLVDCPLVGVPPSMGSLSVLEVDPSQSINQFKGVVDKLIGGGDDESNSGVRNTLKELEEVFDTLPAGTDEVVALAKVINLVKKGGYDRIVIDTAPTGHTLRMLSTPGFLAELIDRLLAIADKVNSNAAVKLLVAGSAKSEELETAAITAKSTLLSFQMQMYDLEDLFSDPYQTEFIIVTVPTELAVRESTRLLNDLTFEAPDMPIKVRNVVVNQVLKDDGSDAQTFLSHVHDGQMTSIEELRSATCHMSSPPCVTTVPYIDTEPRGVFGLNILADALLRE
ncbi:anion-transporting ATPase-like domain containing protein [Nitzschia inconspicua]|uniref:Anion-transporting ATPase-like domain containing protein n=1 Tax=Nitzschia inconspicua TaxID=303405 RepID=A0A9K3L0G9_9STRA|nr:anion-transporting ATPase-like domain containing protein [Nitzschia inconspicua]